MTKKKTNLRTSQLKKGIQSRMHRASEQEVKLSNPAEFFKKMSSPVEGRLYSFMKQVQDTTEEMLDITGVSKIVEIGEGGKWRWRQVKTTADLKEMLSNAGKHYEQFIKIRESDIVRAIRAKEDFGYDSGGAASVGAMPVRNEYTPLIGTPFFKQMYLSDYWEMHSKVFWYGNYSAIGKMVLDTTTNFVMGKGFSIDFKEKKHQDIWKSYENRSNIQEMAHQWCKSLGWFGELMIKKIPGKGGILHKDFDPSTIWEIVTDPEDISDVKYYHQQFNTQYQIYTTPNTPSSKYIINQLPPQLVQHYKVNVTNYEKRGRSDLLSVLLYFKYFEDYMTAKLIRAKNEAAFIWDVEIDGDEEDIQNYLNTTESIVDAPPGSENVHNKAIKRTPLAPTFSKGATDQISSDILSYVAMGTSIPVNYFGTALTGNSTKAGSLVATEPVARKMMHRQQRMEHILRGIVKDVMIDAGMDFNKCTFEINFPQILEEDRSQKIQDVNLAEQSGYIAKKTAAGIVAKELNITNYDYEAEQELIAEEQQNSLLDLGDDASNAGKDGDLTDKDPAQQNDKKRAFDRAKVKKDGLSI